MVTEAQRQNIDRLLVQWEKASSGGLRVGGISNPLAAMAAKGTRAPTLDVIFHDEVARTQHALEAMHVYLRNVLINSRFDGKRQYQDAGPRPSRWTLWRRKQKAAEQVGRAEEEFLLQYRTLKYGWRAA